MPLIYLSLGAGVQSSTLALMASAGELPPEHTPSVAIFADTQAEPKAVYKWLDWLEKQLTFPVIRVSYGDLEAESLRIRRSKKSGKLYINRAVPFFLKNPDGTTGTFNRRCTSRFKIEVITRKVRELIGRENLLAWRRAYRDNRCHPPAARALIGISRDEAIRAKPSRFPFVEHVWPLLDAGIRRQDCLNWMARQGHPSPPRSACVFCPYHDRNEWRRLKNGDPEGFARAVHFEKESQRLSEKVDEVVRGVPFLTRALVPLDEIDFDTPDPQMKLFENDTGFGNECEGMCGV